MSDLPDNLKKLLEGIDDQALSAGGPLEILTVQGFISEEEISGLFSYNDVVVRVADPKAVTSADEEKIGQRIKIGQGKFENCLNEVYRVALAKGTLEGYCQVNDAAAQKVAKLTEDIGVQAGLLRDSNKVRDDWKRVAGEAKEQLAEAEKCSAKSDERASDLEAELGDAREALGNANDHSGRVEKSNQELGEMIKEGRKENQGLIESRQELRVQIHEIGEQNKKEAKEFEARLQGQRDDIERLHEEVRRQAKLADHYEELADKRLIRRVGRGLWSIVQKIDDKHSPA